MDKDESEVTEGVRTNSKDVYSAEILVTPQDNLMVPADLSSRIETAL